MLITASTAAARELYEVFAIYPVRVNPAALWTSASADKPGPAREATRPPLQSRTESQVSFSGLAPRSHVNSLTN